MSSTTFINAVQARQNTRDQSVIHDEIRSIESAILANIDAGVLYANISNGTAMTDSNVYYNVYNGLSDDATVLDQINYVTRYFINLEYGVIITTNDSTGDTIRWNISW